jgi:hypothetical protein
MTNATRPPTAADGPMASIAGAIEGMARSLLVALIRNGAISVQDALAVFDDARALVEPQHGSQSPGAIMIRSIYRDLEDSLREVRPGEAPRPANRKLDAPTSD